ncbi:MAG: protein translocase subunit SecD [Acidimicrobiia bacterium]|nr:protein translocase subunit SecD [Acidimicrobiia bacterium]
MTLRSKLLVSFGLAGILLMLGVYPIVATSLGLPVPGWLADMRLRLGLDLQGGVHMVLRVHTDDALRVEAESEMERLREMLDTAGITVSRTAVTSPTEFVVEGISPEQDQAFRQAAVEVEATFDRSGGANGAYRFTMKPNLQVQLREEAVTQARQTIERRVDELGVTEPSIAEHGTGGDQILVQLPGVADVERAKGIIGRTGLLELKIVEQGPAATREELLVGGQPPENMEIVPGSSGDPSTPGVTVHYLVRRVAAVTGRDLRNARPTLDENNQPAVSFSLNQEGARKFGNVTATNIGRQLAVILDNRVYTAPTIESRITDQGRITGSFSQQEAQDLSLVLRSGALPASLTYLEERTIGPTLGADSIRSGVIASMVGLLLVVTFMLVFYRLSGVNAVVALIFNLVILLGLMAYLGAVMTLPGIAGFVLTMGIGVDSNVLIFERIKEELEANRGVRASVNAGFSRVFLTLLDTHIAALIAAAFLFQFGTGPIRGFAVTLSLGLVSNLFTSTFVSKTLFELVLSRRQAATLSI